MAYEATLIYETAAPIPFIVDNATGIEKGTILKMADPMTASASTGVSDIVAGIAASEKIASDGKTKLGVYREGIFKVRASGSITIGYPCSTAGTGNYVQQAPNALSGSKTLGISMETAADGETFLMELKPGANSSG